MASTLGTAAAERLDNSRGVLAKKRRVAEPVKRLSAWLSLIDCGRLSAAVQDHAGGLQIAFSRRTLRLVASPWPC